LGEKKSTVLTFKKLDDIDFSHLTTTQSDEIKNLLWEFRLTFDDKPGTCRTATHKINLEGGLWIIDR